MCSKTQTAETLFTCTYSVSPFSKLSDCTSNVFKKRPTVFLSLKTPNIYLRCSSVWIHWLEDCSDSLLYLYYCSLQMSWTRRDELCYDVNVILIGQSLFVFYISAMSCSLLRQWLRREDDWLLKHGERFIGQWTCQCSTRFYHWNRSCGIFHVAVIVLIHGSWQIFSPHHRVRFQCLLPVTFMKHTGDFSFHSVMTVTVKNWIVSITVTEEKEVLCKPCFLHWCSYKCVCLCYFTLQLAAMTWNKPPNLLMQTWRGIDVGHTHTHRMEVCLSQWFQPQAERFSSQQIYFYCSSLTSHEFKDGEDSRWQHDHHELAAALIGDQLHILYDKASVPPTLWSMFWSAHKI